ncbi:oligosaccharide flippase family protein [Oceaniglobus roseus]|uniref:oligosaccharide flippase family protein n=1 Tax=Oceaniglobus roseus TaxID=1737570 RepID=UPI000C7EEB7B|nr:oligosaccharide flippase family protein [Kandeliimicrobium roseum]
MGTGTDAGAGALPLWRAMKRRSRGAGPLALLLSPMAVGMGARVAVQLVAFVQIMIAARYLELADFGTYTLGWACCVILISLVYTGFYQALLRSPDFETERHTGFCAMAAIGAGGAALMVAVGLATLGNGADTGAVFLALAPLPLLRALVAWSEAHLVRDRRVRFVSLYGMVSESIALVVTWGALLAGSGVFALVFGRYAVLAVEMAMVLMADRSRPRLAFSGAAFARLRTTALPLWGTSGLGMMSSYGADLILGAFLNTAAVGAYRSGARISQTAADLIFQPLNTISWSRMSQAEKAGEHHELKRIWLDHTGFGAALLWPILAAFAILAKDLVLFLFDATWLPAAPVIVLLSLSRGVGFLSVLLEPAMVCQGLGRTQLWVRAVALVAFIAALLTFGRFGAAEAAWAHVLMSAVSSVLTVAVIRATLKVGLAEILRTLAPAVAITALCIAGLELSAPARAALGATGGLLSAVAGLAVVWGLAVLFCLRRRYIALPRP